MPNFLRLESMLFASTATSIVALLALLILREATKRRQDAGGGGDSHVAMSLSTPSWQVPSMEAMVVMDRSVDRRKRMEPIDGMVHGECMEHVVVDRAMSWNWNNG